MLRTVLLSALLGVLPALALAADPSEHDMQAEHMLGMLIQLEEGPRLMTQACKAVDPKGDAPREKLYEDWKTKNKDLFAKIDGYAGEILPQLLAIVRPDDTSDAVSSFRAKQQNEMGQEIAQITPDRRKQTCDDFPHAMFFNQERNDAFAKHAFELLDTWKKEHVANHSA